MTARLIRLVLACVVIVFGFGPLTADNPPSPDVTLSVPTLVARGGHSICGLTMSSALRTQFQAQGGKITVEWRSSGGRGSLARVAGQQGFDAAFDMAGLEVGQVSLTGVVTIGPDPVSSPSTATVATASVSPSSATAEPLTTITPTVTVSPAAGVTFAAPPATATWVDPTNNTQIQQGSFSMASAQVVGGNWVVQPSIFVPQTTRGTVLLQFSIGVNSTDPTTGNPTIVQLTTSMTVMIQQANPPLGITLVTPPGTHFTAGTNAVVQFSVTTSDPGPNTSATFTLFDSSFTSLAAGTALVVGATSPMTGTATVPIPSKAAGNCSVILLVQRTIPGALPGLEQVTAELGIVVDPAAVPVFTITTPNPLAVTAGQTATINYTIQTPPSPATATIAAVFTDQSTGATVLSLTSDSSSWVTQADGSVTGTLAFVFPQSQVNAAMVTTATFTLDSNGSAVANTSITVDVAPAPAPAPVSVAIASMTSPVTEGSPASLTVVVTGATPAQVASIFFSFIDAQGSTAFTGDIPVTLLQYVGTALQATVQYTLPSTLAAATYTFQVTLVTAGPSPQTVTTSAQVPVLPPTTLTISPASGTIIEGQPTVVVGVVHPQVGVGGATWDCRNLLGTVVPGLTGAVAANAFTPIVDAQGPGWSFQFTILAAQGTFTGTTSLTLVVVFTDANGHTTTATGSFTGQPAPPPVVTPVQNLTAAQATLTTILADPNLTQVQLTHLEHAQDMLAHLLQDIANSTFGGHFSVIAQWITNITAEITNAGVNSAAVNGLITTLTNIATSVAAIPDVVRITVSPRPHIIAGTRHTFTLILHGTGGTTLNPQDFPAYAVPRLTIVDLGGGKNTPGLPGDPGAFVLSIDGGGLSMDYQCTRAGDTHVTATVVFTSTSIPANTPNPPGFGTSTTFTVAQNPPGQGEDKFQITSVTDKDGLDLRDGVNLLVIPEKLPVHIKVRYISDYNDDEQAEVKLVFNRSDSAQRQYYTQTAPVPSPPRVRLIPPDPPVQGPIATWGPGQEIPFTFDGLDDLGRLIIQGNTGRYGLVVKAIEDGAEAQDIDPNNDDDDSTMIHISMPVPRYRFVNGSTLGWDDPHRCYIDRGVRDENGVSHLFHDASDTLQIWALPGSEVSVKLNDATGVVLFPRGADNPFTFTMPPGVPGRLRKYDIAIHSSQTDEINTPAFTITVTPPGGGIPTPMDTLGAVAFELQGEVGEPLDNTPGFAIAISPGGPRVDSEVAHYLRLVRTKPIPSSDHLMHKPDDADFRSVGVIHYGWRLAVTAAGVASRATVTVRRSRAWDSTSLSWDVSDQRDPITISLDANGIESTSGQFDWLWSVDAQNDSAFKIGFWLAFNAGSIVQANAPFGNSDARIRSEFSGGRLAPRFEVDPLRPF